MIVAFWGGPKEARIAAKMVLGLYLEAFGAPLGALLGPFGGPLGADMGLQKGSEKCSGATLGPLRPTLDLTWAKLAQPGPIWALRGPQTGPKWAPSRPNLGQIWGHVGPF